MIERRLSVTEAARNFAELVNRTHYRGESTLLLRSGKALARLIPAEGSSCLGADLAAKWKAMVKLPSDEAEAFASDVENGRASIEFPDSKWD